MTVAASLKVGIGTKDPKSLVLAFLPSLTLFVPAPAKRENTHQTALDLWWLRLVIFMYVYMHVRISSRSDLEGTA